MSEKPKNMFVTLLALITTMFFSVLSDGNRELLECRLAPQRCPDQDDFDCRCVIEPNYYNDTAQECISISWVCDGWSDCLDGSDEINCICPSDHFQCGCERGGECSQAFQCIPNEKLCNQQSDCWNNKDEISRSCCEHNSCDGYHDCPDYRDEYNCTCPFNKPYPCECNSPEKFSCNSDSGQSYQSCYEESERCDGRTHCSDSSDEWNCTANAMSIYPLPCACNKPDEFTCEKGLVSTSDNYLCDGAMFCVDGSDEWNCTDCPKDRPFRCDCNKPRDFSCVGRWSCVKENDKCNGMIDCSDGSDEWNCSCPQNLPYRCDCNNVHDFSCQKTIVCYDDAMKCNAYIDCEDLTDEKKCTPCLEEDFDCGCSAVDAISTCFKEKRCISSEKENDGKTDCYNGHDESLVEYVKTTKCKSCDLLLFRLKSLKNCDLISSCEPSTCFSECHNCSSVICRSNCSDGTIAKTCDKVIQCSGGDLVSFDKFCDGKSDCEDESDEVRSRGFGFKCEDANLSKRSCVLPQRNLYDNIPHCRDQSDICFELDGTLSSRCFRCYDRQLIISSQQLCDGIIDCYDLSDECLCLKNLYFAVCNYAFLSDEHKALQCNISNMLQCHDVRGKHVKEATCRKLELDGEDIHQSVQRVSPSRIKCKNKWGDVIANLCDGKPECKYFEDECSSVCAKKGNLPPFCYDICHSFYPLGDRYCDGFEDEAWKFIEDSRCPKGFDERNCSYRYRCISGTKVSIDKVQLCDGKNDCDDESDERNCDTSSQSTQIIFSSNTQLIRNAFFRVCIWIMAIFTLSGNVYVIIITTTTLRKKRLLYAVQCNHIILLNLAIADLLMGIYLLIICTKMTQFSGSYKIFDYEWRTSMLCSAAGCLAILSSETSCFLMGILTAFRLVNILFPIKALSIHTAVWKLLILGSWISSLFLALVPLLPSTAQYFVHTIWFQNRYSTSSGWKKSDVTTFACRHASLSNITVLTKGGIWKTTKSYFDSYFPQLSIKGELGYYGDTSVCLPRLFVAYGDNAWEYTLAVITVNFLSFLFVVAGYILIYKNSAKAPIRANKSESQQRKLQQRIARLIFTDFCCWIPISIMAYIRLAGGYFSSDVYALSATLLLPINSSLNPILYSSLFDKIIDKFTNKSNTTNSNNTNELGTREVTLRPTIRAPAYLPSAL